METYLGKPTTVAFSALHLDGNNPRLAPDEPPGYDDPAALFDLDLQRRLREQAPDALSIAPLEQAIISQGWMPIDNIVTWRHPDDPDRVVVLEGNRRTATLMALRPRLQRERDKLTRMTSGGRRYSDQDLAEQRRLVEGLQRVVDDTEQLEVVPLAAETPADLARKLPRVLAVRHITGARQWGSYAEDLWLLVRYEGLYAEQHPGADLRWEQSIVKQVADEASLSSVATKRKLRAARCFSHFKREFEDKLPGGEEFDSGDYYLFEQIVAKPFLRDRFGLGEDALHLPEDREQALFEWTFKLPRGDRRSAENNPNVFYRHENVVVWDQMKRYDDRNGTAFAQRFAVDDPGAAPKMRDVEADYVTHKARRRPTDVLEQLLQALEGLNMTTLSDEGAFLRAQLERLDQRTRTILAMVKAAETVPGS